MNKPISQMGRDELITRIAELTAANKLQADAMIFLAEQVAVLEEQNESLEGQLMNIGEYNNE